MVPLLTKTDGGEEAVQREKPRLQSENTECEMLTPTVGVLEVC